jgi:hypothetical protein
MRWPAWGADAAPAKVATDPASKATAAPTTNCLILRVCNIRDFMILPSSR